MTGTIFNHLSTVNASSVNQFKNELQKHWRSHPLKYTPYQRQSSQVTRGTQAEASSLYTKVYQSIIHVHHAGSITRDLLMTGQMAQQVPHRVTLPLLASIH